MMSLEVAKEIKRQLQIGILMSCGARNFVGTQDGLIFNVGPGNKNKIVIRLDPSDTYTVAYHYGFTKVEEVDDVYVDSLNTVVRRLGDRRKYGVKQVS